MACLVRLTDVWNIRKNAFISQYNDNSFLISTIKRIERKLADLEPPLSPYPYLSNFHREETYLTKLEHERLACLYVLKIDTREIAPCHLFFPVLESPHKIKRAPLVRPVMDELGWLPPGM